MVLTLGSEVLGHRGSEETGPLWPVARRALLSSAVQCSELRAVSIRPPLSRRFDAPTLPASVVYRCSALPLSLSLNAWPPSNNWPRVEPFSFSKRKCFLRWKHLSNKDSKDSRRKLPSAELALLRRGGGGRSRVGHPAATLTLIYSRDIRVEI